MESIPLVSVIVPNYNYVKYLTLRIETIMRQTYTNFELILLDDASTDGSAEVLKDYQNNEKVSCLEINGQNTGSPFLQWKKGISKARGEYIWIAESDDLAELKMLEMAVSLLEKYQDASFVFFGAHLIDANGNKLRKDYDRWTFQKKHSRRGYKVFEGKKYVTHNLYWKNYVYNASGVIFRKAYFSTLKDSQCFDMRYTGDWLFWVQLALQGQVIEVYRKMNYYRKHCKSATVEGRRIGTGISEEIEVIKYIEDTISMGYLKRVLRHGAFYKRIKRMNVSLEVKELLFAKLVDYWGTRKNAYRIERFNKFLSHIFVMLNRERMERC